MIRQLARRWGNPLVVCGLLAALAGCTSTPSSVRASDGTDQPPVPTGTPSTGTGSYAATSSPSATATPSSRARDACVRAFGSAVGTAGPTTIGDIRHSGGGPAASNGVANMPATHAFGQEPDTATGAWCWVRDGDGWTLFGIDMHGEPIAMYSWTDWTDPAPPTPPVGIAAWF